MPPIQVFRSHCSGMAEVQNLSIITGRSAGRRWSGGLATARAAQPRARGAQLSYFPMLSIPLEAANLPSSLGLLATLQPLCADSQPPPGAPPHAVPLGPAQAAHRLAWTPFPAQGVLPAGQQGDVEGVLGLAPGTVGSTGLGQAQSWPRGVRIIRQEKVMVWRILGSRRRLSYWTNWETVSH